MMGVVENIGNTKYDSYIDTALDWLDCYPSNWKIKPGFTILSDRKEKNTGLKSSVVLSLSYGKVIIKPEEKLTGLVPESFETYQLVYPGDIIIRPTDLQNDKISLRTGLAANKGIITSAYINLQVTSPNSSKFFHYYLHALDISKVLYRLGSGLRQNLDYNDFKRFPFVVPPPEEQIRIASFLDKKTAQIDLAIAQKERLIELLKERRQVMIHKAATQGLNPDVKMKDSGVEWIGKIPEHWEVLSNRILFRESKAAGREGLPVLTVSIHTAVSSEELDTTDKIQGRIKIEDKTKYKLVRPGDVVFNMMRAWQGAIGAVRVEGLVSPAYIVATPIEYINSDFFEYQFRTPAYIQQIDRFSKGITDFRKRLYWDEFKQLKTIVPPIEEQKSIADFISESTKKVDNVINFQNQQIEKLKELKSTLINSAVTGKIKV